MPLDNPMVLLDPQIDAIPLDVVLRAVKDHLTADARGAAIAPPRQSAHFPAGRIVFTIGGNASIAGFRAYEDFKSGDRATDDQIVAVWDQRSCRLKGVALGNRLGAIRTGALGGVAVDILASRNARSCGIIGAGIQAETQIRAIAAVRDLTDIRVFSRNAVNRRGFAERIGNRHGLNVRPVDSARQCVEGVDIVILATDSTTPVIDAGWVMPKAHVSTLGPKFRNEHEFPPELASRATIIASDSPQQIAAQADTHMLHGTPAYDRILHLGNLAQGFDADADRGMTLYLSAGLAGSEVAALDAILAHCAK